MQRINVLIKRNFHLPQRYITLLLAVRHYHQGFNSKWPGTVVLRPTVSENDYIGPSNVILQSYRPLFQNLKKYCLTFSCV